MRSQYGPETVDSISASARSPYGISYRNSIKIAPNDKPMYSYVRGIINPILYSLLATTGILTLTPVE